MADCDSIAAEVARLFHLVEQLTEQVSTARDGRDRRLANSALNAARAQLAAKRHQLEVCRSSGSLTDPRVLGREITQGLAGYELVAGKDTLFRVFLGVPEDVLAPPVLPAGATALMVNEPVFHTSSLEFAAISITRPDGVSFEVPGNIDDGTITNFTKSYSTDDNANFWVSGEQLASAGEYTAVARFYRAGALVGVVDFGAHTFHSTKDLRLLIVVDTWPMNAAAWATLVGSLQHVHRAFPIRAGVGPLDGNPQLGLRYRIEPEPFDPDWPAWGPVRQRLAQFNASQQARGLDVAEHIQTVRIQQPGEFPLGGVGEQGPGKSVSGVTLNVNPPADAVFATLIAQEIGHNFGLRHTPEPAIDDPAAIDMLGRRSVASPRSIMYNFYSGTPSENGFFVPSDWAGVLQGLVASTSTGPS